MTDLERALQKALDRAPISQRESTLDAVDWYEVYADWWEKYASPRASWRKG